MSNISLRQYATQLGSNSLRETVRKLLGYDELRVRQAVSWSSSRIIHISDIHCTTRDYLVDANKTAIAVDAAAIVIDIITFGPTIPPALNPVRGDVQDTPAKCKEIVNFLKSSRQMLRANKIVISGDLVDSAGRPDFNAFAKQYLLEPLTSDGFDVTVLPGNHDYFCLGLQAATDSIAKGAEAFFDAFSAFMKTSAANAYPVDLDLGNGNRLILINSLKGHYDAQTDSQRSQGNIGEQQLNWLKNTLPQYQQDRAAGAKIAMAMHHSPFESNTDIELTDAADFLPVIANQIDALMFGHTGLPHQFYLDEAGRWGIPIIASENIDKMQSDGYRVSVIDLSCMEVEVYSTKHGLKNVEKAATAEAVGRS